MSAAAKLLPLRSIGHVTICMDKGGLARFRESGAAKARFPQGGTEAIMINTGGGLAGGDQFGFDIGVGPGAKLSLTTQGAERVYRSLGPAAKVDTKLELAEGSTLRWLPQETILFDHAALQRRYDVELAGGATFLAVEAAIFGRTEMAESISQVELHDRWRIRREGRLIHADDTAIAGTLPVSRATLNGARAMALVIYVAADAERPLDGVRAAIGHGGASAWNGKLVARVLAKDGFELRKSLIPAIRAIAGGTALPKAWSF